LLLPASGAAAASIEWQPWSDAAFQLAKREHKFVIMDLEAVWCHWCHVMDETTYKDPRVIKLFAEHYVAVRVDEDSRPDLAGRYEDYGWPATIVFAPDGSEIVRRRGYLPPGTMASMLQAIVDDPSPGPSVTSGGGAPAKVPEGGLEATLRKNLLSQYDHAAGGWSGEHKFLDRDNVEYCIRQGLRGDGEAKAIATDMLRLQLQLFDPAWGGVYQYSAEGDWVHPHFEKIMSIQADDLGVYSLAAAAWPDSGYAKDAAQIVRYLDTFLRSPEGAFYTSQDADLVQGEHGGDYFALGDQARRSRGIPRVDMHSYSRENGWVVSALCAYADATGDKRALDEAVQAANWVIAHRGLAGGGFRHDEADAAGPYLGDTLSMGAAFLALHGSTGDPLWLGRSEASADFIQAHFGRGSESGFASSDTTKASFPRPQPELGETTALARFAAHLGRASGRPADREMAESALRWALQPDVALRQGGYSGGILLAIDELRTEPLHVTVVGRRGDAAAQALFDAARSAATSHRLVEWWDRSEGPPPRGESIFPTLDHAAAFLCANGACSSPIKDPGALEKRIAKAIAASGQQ
jgi:uncharacterized protein YyaL (SSP411 family)